MTKVKARNCYENLQLCIEKFDDVYEQNVLPIYSWLAILRKYDYLLEYQKEERLEKLIQKHIADYEGIAEEINSIKSDINFIESYVPQKINYGFIELHFKDIKSELLRNGNQMINYLLEVLEDQFKDLLNESEVNFKKIIEFL